MNTLIFFLAIAYTVVYAFTKARRDYNVILNDKGRTIYSDRWHSWGMAQSMVAFTPWIILLLFGYDLYLFALLTVVVSLMFWQLNESLIGYFLYKELFYIDNSKFGLWLKRVFWNGFNVFVIRFVIIGCVTLEYFRNI